RRHTRFSRDWSSDVCSSDLFTVLLFIGVPIALVLAVSAMIYIQSSGNSVLFLSYPQQFFGGLDNYGLLAIPLFMLVGELMNEGRSEERRVGKECRWRGSPYR